jgi:myosin heavy subunit
MSDVNERRERLQIALRAAGEALGGLTQAERDSAPGSAELLERVVAYAQIVVEQTDDEVITDAALSGIESHANTIASSPSSAIANSRANADPILTSVATLPLARDRDVAQAVKEIVANLQRSATHRLNALEAEAQSKRSEIETALTELRATVDSMSETTKAEIETSSAGFQSKLADFESTLSTQRQSLDQMVTRHSETFSETQEERATAFQAEITKTREQIAAMIKESSAEVEQHVAEIRRMEDESSGLVHSIGLGGTAERYGDEAKDQKKVADQLRLATIALALGAVVMAVFAVVHQSDKTSTVLAKLGVSAVFGALATYTGRQSGRHRVREERARNLQLELTAFAPFIEQLDDDQKELERVIMTRKTFGQIPSLPESADIEHSFGPLGPVLDKIARRGKREE